MILLLIMIHLFLLHGIVDATDLTSYISNNGKLSQRRYSKPSKSAGSCLDITDEIKALNWLYSDTSSDSYCMSCKMSQESCPFEPPCQHLIDKLYRECDGITLPHGAFYDPDLTIDGKWSDEVKTKIKASVEKCGCSSAPTIFLLRLLRIFYAMLVVSFKLLC